MDISKIAYALTLKTRPSKRQWWVSKGFTRLGNSRLVSYWEKRIANNECDRALAEGIWRDYKKQISLVGRALSLTQSIKDWAEDDFRFAVNEVTQSRLDACKQCEKWDAKAFLGTGKCKLCGCSTKAKLRIKTERCPVGKW